MTNESIKDTFKKERTSALSEMFDNVSEIGIYPTTQLFERLDVAFECGLNAARQDEREKMAVQQPAQSDAVEFMEWAAGAGWQTYDGPDRWICPQENKRVLTTIELYKLFPKPKQ